MTQALRKTALYCRLSKDDDDKDKNDSESIKTQKAMLSQYAAEQGFLVAETYIDDGWSGLNFERPSFNRMLDDIEDGKIDIVITKDLSRLGRDHLKVGYFTEIYFSMKRVRYIAINDNVDTTGGNNDMAAPIFSDEVTNGTEEMLLAAKYGRSKQIRAKVAAVILSARMCCDLHPRQPFPNSRSLRVERPERADTI